MERRASISSISSAMTAKLNSSSSFSGASTKLSPLIDLERFVYRFKVLLRNSETDKAKLVKVNFFLKELVKRVTCSREVPKIIMIFYKTK